MQALLQPFPMLTGRRAQVWHHHPSFLRPRHFHAEPELNVVARGHGVLSVGHERLEVRAGDAVYLQPGQDHALLSESPDFELFVLALQPQLADHCKLRAARSIGVVSLPDAMLSSLKAVWLELGQVRDAAVVEHRLAEHFRDLVSRFEPAPALCRRTIQTLQSTPEAKEGYVASLLTAHPSEVSRAVRTGLGMRLVDFRTQLRLISFVQGVDRGGSLTRAAFSSGFGSYSQLHRVFRKHLGCTPLDYFAGKREQLDTLLQRDLGRSEELIQPPPETVVQERS